jgi:hypothetical protein
LLVVPSESAERKPAVKNPANIPQAEEAIGWGVWVAFENDDSLQWFRGVIVDYYKTSKKPIYQVIDAAP